LAPNLIGREAAAKSGASPSWPIFDYSLIVRTVLEVGCVGIVDRRRIYLVVVFHYELDVGSEIG
jgi:hypothetical protein